MEPVAEAVWGGFESLRHPRPGWDPTGSGTLLSATEARSPTVAEALAGNRWLRLSQGIGG